MLHGFTRPATVLAWRTACGYNRARTHCRPKVVSFMELDISTQSADASCTIALKGEVDVYTSPRLREELNGAVEDGCLHIIVTMDGVEFIDSSGLGVLVSALRRVKEQGGTLRLVCTKEGILKIFRITGLDKVFPLFTTVEEAQGF